MDYLKKHFVFKCNLSMSACFPTFSLYKFDKVSLELMSSIFFIIFMLFASSSAYGNKSYLEPYGFLLTHIVATSAPADTFGYSHSAAPTGANQKSNSDPYQSTLSFQAQQSRVGVNIKLDDQTQGKLELDFFSAAKASPTVAALPRLRIAKITTRTPSNIQLNMGQDWDYFSPLAPHTYNFIGNGFMAGNIGFMRHLLGISNMTNATEWALAIGLPVANDTATYANVEYSFSPNISAKLSMVEGSNKMGLSCLYAQLIANNERSKLTEAGGLSGHFEHSWNDFNLRAEIYRGANLNNLGTFGISQGRFNSNSWTNLREFGFFISSKWQSENLGIYGGLGHAEILNPSEVAPRTPATSTTPANPLGILKNNSIRFGIDETLSSTLKLFAELNQFFTEYVDTGMEKIDVFSLGLHMPF